MKKLHPLNWIQWLTLILAAATAASFLILYSQISNVQAHQNDALDSILCFAEHTVQVRPGIPEKQRQAALAFYRRAIADANLKPCP